MHRKCGCFPLEKRAAIVRHYLACFFSLRAVFLCFHTASCEANSFTTDGYGIFDVHTNLDVCRTHKQVCTRVDSQGQTNFSSPCPARGSNPGSSDFNSDSLTTELRPPSITCIHYPNCINLLWSDVNDTLAARLRQVCCVALVENNMSIYTSKQEMSWWNREQ